MSASRGSPMTTVLQTRRSNRIRLPILWLGENYVHRQEGLTGSVTPSSRIRYASQLSEAFILVPISNEEEEQLLRQPNIARRMMTSRNSERSPIKDEEATFNTSPNWSVQVSPTSETLSQATPDCLCNITADSLLSPPSPLRLGSLTGDSLRSTSSGEMQEPVRRDIGLSDSETLVIDTNTRATDFGGTDTWENLMSSSMNSNVRSQCPLCYSGWTGTRLD